MVDPKLQSDNDQLLAELRDRALDDPVAFVDNNQYCKSLACAMLAQWINNDEYPDD